MGEQLYNQQLYEDLLQGDEEAAGKYLGMALERNPEHSFYGGTKHLDGAFRWSETREGDLYWRRANRKVYELRSRRK